MQEALHHPETTVHPGIDGTQERAVFVAGVNVLWQRRL